MRTLRKLLCLLFVTTLFESSPASAASPVEIKIATVAPRGSVWTKIFLKMAREVEEKTGGAVKVRLFPGQVQGDERDVVRKMRTGQLQGGAFTAIGLGLLDPEVLVMQMPGMFRDYDSLDHAWEALTPYFEESFSKHGYVLLGWSEVGKIYTFSKRPITSLADLRATKSWAWTDDPITKAMLRELGVEPRLLALPAVLPALNTGMIDTVINSPLGCMALQWHSQVSHISAEHSGIGIAATVVTKEAWDSISPENRKIALEIGRRYNRVLRTITRRDNERALEAMKKSGMHVDAFSEDDKKAIERAAVRVTRSFVPRYYSLDLLKRVVALRTEPLPKDLEEELTESK